MSDSAPPTDASLEIRDPEIGDAPLRRRVQTTIEKPPVDSAIFTPKQGDLLTEPRLFVQRPLEITWAERWELFSQTKRWKQIRPFLSLTSVVVFLSVLWLFWILMDFQFVRDAEAYSPKTKCSHPLVLFKDSSLRSHKEVPYLDLEIPNYDFLIDLMKTSTCYLRNYAQNMSCITPIAYGIDARLISMRRKNGDIIHLINPKNPSNPGKHMKIPEGNSLLPGHPTVNVSRPAVLYIEYIDADFKSTKKDRFEMGDAFCIGSSIDLFNHIIPQLGDVTKGHTETSQK